MLKTDFFSDREFELLLTLVQPFDATYPEIQFHADRLLFELANAMSNGGGDETFEEFRARGDRVRQKRGVVHFHPTSQIFCLFKPLIRLTTLLALQFPAIDESIDRFVYELSKSIDGGRSPESFEDFHLEQRLLRSVVTSPVRGQG